MKLRDLILVLVLSLAFGAVMAKCETSADPCQRGDGSLLFGLKNPQKQAFPSEEAGRIYCAAIAAFRQEVKAQGAMYPDLTIELGAERDRIETVNRKSVVYLHKWNPVSFAEGVIIAARDQLMTADEIAEIGRRALALVGSTVSAKQLGGKQ